MHAFGWWGFWAGKQWAWIVGVILFIVSIVFSAVGMVWAPTNVISVIIDALILYYLFRPNVKAWFGRTQSARKIQMIGTWVVPEFPTWTLMLLTLIILTVAIAIYKRRILKTPIH